MASYIDRLLSNVKNTPEVKRVFDSIFKKYPEYMCGAKTPISNQVFSPATNELDNPTSIYFTSKATNTLNTIRKVSKIQAVSRENSHKNDRPIEFLCTGYVDFSGDVIITNISIPFMEIIRENSATPDSFYEQFFLSQKPSEAHKSLISDFNEYLRCNTMDSKSPIGTEIVAMIGTTKPATDDINTTNCFNLQEVAQGVIRGDIKPKSPIRTGVIAITPNTFAKSKGKFVELPGSLECMLTSYDYNRNGTCYPVNIENVVSAYTSDKNHRISSISISSSFQDKNGLPLPKFKFNKQTTM